MEYLRKWLSESDGAGESLQRAQEEYDARLKDLIANDPRATELEQSLLDRQKQSDLAQRELQFHKEKAKAAFAAAYEAKPDEGNQMLEGRVSISIRRSSVGHWDPASAAREGKRQTEQNPMLFDTLFAPVKQGFKKLIGMGIPISPETMQIQEIVIVLFHGGHEMLRAFRNPLIQPAPE